MDDKKMGFVRYVVNRYLRQLPAFHEYREELEQEGAIAYIQADASYDPKYGKDKDLYIYYAVKRSLMMFMRSESKHFTKEEVDHESPYWPMNNPVDPDSLPAPVKEARRDLADIVGAMDMTDRDMEILGVYLGCGSVTVTAEKLGVTKQYVSKRISQFVTDAKVQVDKS